MANPFNFGNIRRNDRRTRQINPIPGSLSLLKKVKAWYDKDPNHWQHGDLGVQNVSMCIVGALTHFGSGGTMFTDDMIRVVRDIINREHIQTEEAAIFAVENDPLINATAMLVETVDSADPNSEPIRMELLTVYSEKFGKTLTFRLPVPRATILIENNDKYSEEESRARIMDALDRSIAWAEKTVTV